MSGGLATPSLRRRVTWVVIALVAAMVLALGVVTDRVLADRLDAQLRDRLLDRASVAAALVDQVDARDLARRLEGDGVSAVVFATDGEVYAEGPLGGGAPGATPSPGPATSSPSGSGEGPRGPGPDRGDPPAPPTPPGAEPQVVESGETLSVDRELADGTRVLLLADAGDVAATMAQVRLALLVAGLAVLLLAGLAVPLVVRRALRPLDRVTEVTRGIADGDRALRLRPTDPTTELGRTATAFDLVLDEVTGAEHRAQVSEARLRAFVDDAAHELRTPLTGVQAAAERVLRDDPAREEREQVLRMLVREARRAGRLVEDMLLVGRIDAGLEVRREPVDVGAVVDDVLAARGLTHPGARLERVGTPGAADVVGDRDRLAQVLGNLVDNAVTAAGPEARVEVGLARRGDDVVVRVRDDGPGVPVADRERVFDRLVRLDEARSSHRGGAGLGLPIARGLARAHGGDLRCVEPPEDDGPRGACFELVLPAGR